MGSITTGIITILVYLTLASIFASMVTYGMSSSEIDIPSVIDWVSQKHMEVDATLCNNLTNQTFIPSTGTWECNGTYGYMATGTGINRVFVYPSEGANSTYKNTYNINNVNNQEFKVFLSWTQAPWSLTASTIELQVLDDKIWLGKCTYFGTICTTIDEEYINLTGESDLTITTTYKYAELLDGYSPVSATVGGYYLEGETLYVAGYYGGVEVAGAGLAIEKLSSDSTVYHEAALDPDNPYSMFTYALFLLAWNAPGFPTEANVILFKLPIVALVILVVAWLKPIGGD